LGSDFARLGVFAAADGVWGVLHLVLGVVVLGLLVRDYGLVGLEVFTNSLIYGLLADFVIIGRFHFDHVLQIVYVIGIEL